MPRREIKFRGWQRGVGVFLTIAGGLFASGINVRAQGAHTVASGIQGDRENSVRKSQPSPSPHQRQASQKINLTVQDSTIRDVILAISRQLDRPVSFNNVDPRFSKRISVRIAGQEVMDAFATVLKGTGLVAVLAQDGRTIVVRPRERDTQVDTLAGKSGRVSGAVIDSANQKTVEGATVSIQGSDIRAVTSKNGQFSLSNVPLGRQVLQIKMFGYQMFTRVLEISDGDQVKVTGILTPVSTMLSEVVTTAVGTQRKVEVGNDIARLNVDSIMQIAPISSVTDLLATRVPGVVVMPSSGVPGAPSRIRFRGTSSVERSSDPIIVIDGIRVNDEQPTAGDLVRGPADSRTSSFVGRPAAIDQIDPNTIESIEIFRGASASALYGADAGNGVIVITTKRGKPGRFRWNVTLNEGFTEIPGTWATNYFAFGRTRDGVSQSCGLADARSAFCVEIDSVILSQPLNDPGLTVLDRGTNRGISATLSGGEGNLTYSFTASGASEVGVFRLPVFEVERFVQDHQFPAPGWMRRPDRLESWSGQSQVNLNLGKTAGTVTLISSLLRNEQQQSSLHSAIGRLQSEALRAHLLGQEPLLKDFYFRRVNDALTFRNSANLSGWQVRSWLPIVATAGIEINNAEARTILPHGYVLGSDDSLGTYSLSRGMTQYTTLNIGTTLQRQRFGRIPGVRVPIGFQYMARSTNSVSGSTDVIPAGVTEPTTIGNGAAGINSGRTSTATFGWYVAPMLDFGSRFFFNPGFRFDNGSGWGSTSGFSGFPKLDFSWIAIDRAERPLLGFLTLLRPRVAFGIAGVQPAPGDHLRLFGPKTLASFDATAPAERAELHSVGNTKLRPERSREFEGGFDAEFWNQRVTSTVSMYRKLRYDAIISSPVAPSVGFAGSSFKLNVGDIRNSGVDASIGALLIDRKAVNWHVNANIHRNSNVLQSLAPGVSDRREGQAGRVRLVPGYPLFGIWHNPVVGYTDDNGNGFIEPWELVRRDSAVFIGTQEPQFQYTMGTSIALWNSRVRISTAVDYQHGLTQEVGNDMDLSTRLYNPSLSLTQQAKLYERVQRVSVLRWQSLSVNFHAPSSVARRIRASSLSIAIQGSNLGLHTNYSGKDPAVNGFGAGGNRVVDNGELPRPRLWRLNVMIGG